MRTLALSIALGLALSMAGCTPFATTGQTIVSGQKWSYQTASIVYRRQIAGSAKDPQSARLRTLSIAYPHPTGKAGYARVELVEESLLPAGTSSTETERGWFAWLRRSSRDHLPGVSYADGVRGAWAMDLKISQVNKLLYELDQEGYFGPRPAAVTESSLAVNVNGVPFDKPWSKVAELDTLAGRVRWEGELVSHNQRTADFSLAKVSGALPGPNNPATTPPGGALSVSAAAAGGAAAFSQPASFTSAAPVNDNLVTRLPPVESPAAFLAEQPAAVRR